MPISGLRIRNSLTLLVASESYNITYDANHSRIPVDFNFSRKIFLQLFLQISFVGFLCSMFNNVVKNVFQVFCDFFFFFCFLLQSSFSKSCSLPPTLVSFWLQLLVQLKM